MGIFFAVNPCKIRLEAKVRGEAVNYRIEFEQEEDGRWIADIPELPGAMAYGPSKDEAESKVRAIALQVQCFRFVQ